MTTYTKDQCRAHIADLVAQFKQNETTLLATQEAMIENNFVRPLFRYLNWNVDNEDLSEPQWEFVLQRTTREGSRPDYILQLDGQHLFVMDAKKAQYDMHDPRWLNQVYAYAYSTQNNAPARKIDFAILTDFQEFVVLDCTLYAAKPQALNNFRVIDWRYPDYVARFDELWELFERNNVLAARRGVLSNAPTGIFTRYLSPKQVKANRIPPDKAFLSALDDKKTGWRVRLAKDMKRLNPQTTGEVLTAAVQLLIDRLIFVKVLSDREIEEDYLAKMDAILAKVSEPSQASADDTSWFVACKNLFTELNQMYNGSVFASRPELEAVAVSNKVVRDIIGDLLPENSPYNFAVLPVEILGTIYERFLGRVVHTTDARVKIEDKPEVRKAGGVYYTPQYIVNYIVQNTVGKLLAECKTPADVARLKILDPACGSGSFLLGAYDALIAWHKAYYATEDRRRRTEAPLGRPSSVLRRSSDAYYLDDDGRVRLTAKLKRQILLNNIFGVDIDPQAVEVTRLSLSLKALEETRAAEAHHERTLFNQTLLPDLTSNIKCGNSLIGTDYIYTDDEELKRVKPFDWATEFADVMKAGGFDAVIGNPPYIFTRNQGIDETQKSYFYRHYQHQSSQLNTFGIFIERSFRLLRQNGRLGFITPNNWLTIDTFSPLRKFILESTANLKIANVLQRVFVDANVDTAVVLFDKGIPSDLTLAEISNEKESFSRSIELLTVTPPAYIIQINLPKNGPHQQIIERIESLAKPLAQFCTVSTGLKVYQTGKGKPKQTDREKGERIFHAKTKRNATYGKYLDGVDVRRYVLGWSGEYLSYGDWLAEPRRSVPFKGERLLVRQIPSKPPYLVHAVYTDEPYYNDINSMVIFAPTSNISLQYLLGLINSRVLSFWFCQTFDKLQRRIFPQFKVKELARFPIRAINFADPADKSLHDRLVALVGQMLDLHKRLHAAQTQTDRELYQRQIDATDKQIDALVASRDLYGLTEEEIKIVESA